MPNKLSYLFLLLVVFPYNSYACGHDEFQAKTPQKIHSDEVVIESRRLQSPVKENIRILAFHSQLSIISF